MNLVKMENILDSALLINLKYFYEDLKIYLH